MTYVIGDLVQLKVTWTDVDGDRKDPTTLACRVKDAGGGVTVYTYALGQVIKESDGVYYCNVATGVLSGWWYYRWEAGGAAIGAEESSFYVEPSTVL